MHHPAIRFLGLLGASVMASGCETLIGANFDQPNKVLDAESGAPDHASSDATDGSLPDRSVEGLSEAGDASVEMAIQEEVDSPSDDGEASTDGPMEDADSSADNVSDIRDASIEEPQDADAGDRSVSARRRKHRRRWHR